MVETASFHGESVLSEELAIGQLFPLVYGELRNLVAIQLQSERSNQSLNATGLVHEAYLRLTGDRSFKNRKHFFVVASETMRRILVDRARERQTLKRGGDRSRDNGELDQIACQFTDQELLEIHLMLDDFAKVDPGGAELVRLHVYGGFSIEESADILGVSRASAYRDWTFARAWLRKAIVGSDS